MKITAVTAYVVRPELGALELRDDASCRREGRVAAGELAWLLGGVAANGAPPVVVQPQTVLDVIRLKVTSGGGLADEFNIFIIAGKPVGCPDT